MNFDLMSGSMQRTLKRARTAIELLFPFPVFVVRLGSKLLVNGWQITCFVISAIDSIAPGAILSMILCCIHIKY